MNIQLKNADLSEIDRILELHYRYQVDSIAEEDKADGFVTTPFTKEQMTDLINNENGLFIAKEDREIVAYVMAASWGFWSSWPMFAFMIKDKMSERFPILVTFVNKTNERSYQAHKRKLGLDVIRQFEFNGNSYYEMACHTKD